MADELDQPAGAIIAAFGGIRPMATKLSVPVSTVQGWKQRDSIPAGRMIEIRRIAVENNVQLSVPDEPIIEATAITLPDNSDSGPNEPSKPEPTPEKKSPETRKQIPTPPQANPAGGKISKIAVLALIVSIGATGWLWWSAEGPGAGSDENARMSALEGRIARLADPADDPGKADRETLSKQLVILRDEIKALSPPDLRAALEPVQTEITQLRERIAELDVAAGSTMGSVVDSQLTQRLSDMDASVQKVEQIAAANRQARAVAIAELNSKLAALNERVVGLRNDGARQEAAAIDAISLTLAASQLRRDVERGDPYRDALATLEAVSSDDAELDAVVKRLAVNADAGVASLEELVFSFDETAIEILDNAPENAESTIVDQILDRARRVVRVRRIGTDASPDSMDGRISRAEFLLKEGDVAGVVSILGELEGGGAVAAQPWVSRAKAYVEAGDALELVETMALARLRTAGGS